MKNRSRLLFIFLLALASFSSYGAKSLSYEEAKLRTGVLMVRTTDYIVVCNGVLDSQRIVKSNLHCTYGQHEFTSKQVLKKLSSDYVEDAIFVIGKSRVKIPEDDYGYEELMNLGHSVVKIHANDIRKLRSGEVTINKDVAEFRLKKGILYNQRYLEKVKTNCSSNGELRIFGYVEDRGYMVRFEDTVQAMVASTGGYKYRLSQTNTIKTSGAPLYSKNGSGLSLCALHNADVIGKPNEKHAVRLAD